MHYTCKYLICSIIWILCCMQKYCVSQSTTVRPYKFGFTIDQQQHRSEKRDERGIVMGEFGFITADGIYHVTVYATDEQGRFRILAMKNYPYESPPKTVEVMVQPKIPVTTTTTTRKPLPKHNFNTEACSGCFLANGNNKPKGLDGAAGKTGKNDIRPLSKPLPSAGSASAGPNSSNKPSSGNKFVAQTQPNNFLHSNQKDTNLKALIAQSLAMRELVKQINIAKTPSTFATTTLSTTAPSKTKETKEYENISQNPLNKQKINNNSHKHTNAQKSNTLLAPQISQHNVPTVQHLHSVNSGVASTTNALATQQASAPTLSQSILQQHTSQKVPSAQHLYTVNSGVADTANTFATHLANAPLNTVALSPSILQQHTTQNVPSAQHKHSVNSGAFTAHPSNALLNTVTLSPSILLQHTAQNVPPAQRQHSVSSGAFTPHPANALLNTVTISPSILQQHTAQDVPPAQRQHSVNSGIFTPHPGNTPLSTVTLSPNILQQHTFQNVPSAQHLQSVHSGMPSTTNAFTRQPKHLSNAPLDTIPYSPSTLQKHTFPTNSIQNLPTKLTAHGINIQNTALANSPRPAQDTQDFPLKASTQTQNTNSPSSSSKPFGVNKPETEAKIPTNTLNTLSKGSNQQTSQPKPGATAAAKPPPIMDIIMQKVLPALMGSKSSTPTTLSNKPNAAPSSKIPGSSSANDFNRKTGSSGNGDGDLYRFKYILDYHGHSETGKRNGNKEGTYFAIGDDNVERTIEYVANEFGYQPRIRWRKLNDNEIKSKENTLKDYEFIWFN